MISFQKAIEIATNELSIRQSKITDNDLILTLIMSKTLHEEFGWVFFYTSKKYLETENMDYAIAGNAPFIVDKESGEVITTGTAKPTKYYIEKYKLGEKW